MTLAPGQRLGPYEIGSVLGRGGMGEVWRATDTRLGREVAVKVLPPDFAADRERVARFAREAKLLASLRHAGIATIHAFEEVEGQQLLVMEVAPGEGLDARIARGPVPLDEALPIARQIAEALEEAHEHGIVHRDLKPANVKVTDDGRVKLLDFGLAKAMQGERGTSPSAADPATSRSPTREASPTVAGVILGTAPYMAPEQARGKIVDRRADIWAFGVVLWEMLTGRRLFRGETVSDVVAAVLRAPVDLDALPPETPARVRQILRRCLEREPRKRLRDIGEARVALESGEESTPPSMAALPARSGRRGRTAALIAGAALLSAGAAWLAHPRVPRPELRALSFPVERLGIAFSRAPRISPDGRRVAYISDRRAFVLSLAEPSAEPMDVTPAGVPPGAGARVAYWSPDATALAVASQGSLWRVPAGGGTASLVCDVPESGEVIGGDWGREDEIVFSVWRGGIYRVPASGGRAEPILRNDPKTEVDFHTVRLLPDGKGILFVTHASDAGHHVVELLAGGRRHAILKDATAISRVLFVPPDHLVFEYLDREGIWELPYRPGNLAVTGKPRLVLPEGTAVDVTRDGTMLVVRGAVAPSAQLVWVGHDGNVLSEIGAPARGVHAPSLSPDGTRIVVPLWTENQFDLWSVDAQRAAMSRVTATPELDEEFPSFTPDGTRVLFGALRNLVPRLQVAELSGGAEAHDLFDGVHGMRCAVAPDGRHVAYSLDEGGGKGTLWIASVDARLKLTAPAVPLRGAPVSFESPLQVAPQGDLLVYGTMEGDRMAAFVCSFPDPARRWPVWNGPGEQPRWSADGGRIFFIAGDELREVEVRRGATLSIGTPRRLFSLSERRLRRDAGFDVAPDGRFLMVREGDPMRISVLWNGGSLLERAR